MTLYVEQQHLPKKNKKKTNTLKKTLINHLFTNIFKKACTVLK